MIALWLSHACMYACIHTYMSTYIIGERERGEGKGKGGRGERGVEEDDDSRAMLDIVG